jgi:hypothetical protein
MSVTRQADDYGHCPGCTAHQSECTCDDSTVRGMTDTYATVSLPNRMIVTFRLSGAGRRTWLLDSSDVGVVKAFYNNESDYHHTWREGAATKLRRLQRAAMR